jgi:hypothetical protein
VVRESPVLTMHLSMSALTDGMLVMFPVTPSFFSVLICGVMPTSE